jgi:sugar phosphate isomerase/epimerase
MLSRRDFGKTALAALPVLKAWSAAPVRVGVSTYSFRDLLRTPGKDNVDDIVKAVRQLGVHEIELHSYNTEPAGPNSGPAVPPPPSAYPDPIRTPSPAEVAAAKLKVRNALRDWRLSTPPSAHAAIAAKFQAAGIELFAYRVDYDASFTDQEIEVTFEQAKALGVTRISSLTEMGPRLAPFAAKHKIEVAIHNGPKAGPKTDLPPHFRLNLDIGNLTAVGADPVAFLKEHYPSISHLTIKDRTRAGGNEKFGEGDTPVSEVVKLVADKYPKIPLFVEYEYIGLGTPQEETRRCLSFIKSAL